MHLVLRHARRERADRERLPLQCLAHVDAHVSDARVAGVFPQDQVTDARVGLRKEAPIAAPAHVSVGCTARASDAVNQTGLRVREEDEARAIKARWTHTAESEGSTNLSLRDRNDER